MCDPILLRFATAGGGKQIQAKKGRITIGMSEAEVISILGEPTSKALIDIPRLYWCYGSRPGNKGN